MRRADEKQQQTPRRHAAGPSRCYEPPAVKVFTEEELLAQLGPAQLYNGTLPFEF